MGLESERVMSTNNLKAMFEQLVSAEVERRMAAMLDGLSESENDDDEPRAPKVGRKVYRAPQSNQVDGRTQPRVAYIVKTNRKGQRPTAPDFGNFETAKAAWKAISKARGPMTAKDIEAATGLTKKTVESVVFFLRHQGLIESQSIA